MENTKEEQGAAWMTVPTFGEWDMKNGVMPDYSMDFSKIREMRKQNKKELSRASIGGDEDIFAQKQQQEKKQKLAQAEPKFARPGIVQHRDDSPTGRKKFLSYFQCGCIKA